MKDVLLAPLSLGLFMAPGHVCCCFKAGRRSGDVSPPVVFSIGWGGAESRREEGLTERGRVRRDELCFGDSTGNETCKSTAVQLRREEAGAYPTRSRLIEPWARCSAVVVHFVGEKKKISWRLSWND